MRKFYHISSIISCLCIMIAIFTISCGGGGGSSYIEVDESLPVKMTMTAFATGPDSAELSWTETFASDYRLYMNGTYAGTYYTPIISGKISTLTPNKKYCLIVYAYVFPIGAVSQSNEACFITPPSVHPSIPSDLRATAVSPGQIYLEWLPSTGNFAGYKIYRNGALSASTSVVSYSDMTVQSSTQYCYSISAYDKWGYESPKCAAVCATTPFDNAAPSVPTNLKAVYDPASASNPTIQLSWNASTDNSGRVAGYRIYRNNVFAAQVTADNFADTGLSATTQYCYMITSFDSTGNESAPSSTECAATSWKLYTVDSNVDVWWTSIAVDANDKLHIAYYDGRFTGSNQQVGTVNYATNLSGTWQTVAIDSVAPTIYGSLSLLVNTDGNLHAAYYDFNSYRLRHAMKASGVWIAETIVPNSMNGGNVSMTHDAANHLHLIYRPSGNMTYMTDATGAWTSQVICSHLGYFDRSTYAIAVGSSGEVHIAYYDYTYPSATGVLKYVTNVSGAWVTETVDSMGDVGMYTAIAIDVSGKAHIAYYDVTNGDLKYATNASGTWVAQSIDSTDNVGLSTAIALDASGYIHISYTDATSHTLKYASNASGTWMTYTVDSTSYVEGYWSLNAYTSIAIDSEGKVHISYRGDSHLRYATNR